MRIPAVSSPPVERCFLLIEVILSLVLFAIIFGLVVSSIAVSGAAKDRAEERALAVEVALSKADEIRATPIDLLFSKWGPGGTEGETFSVPGLDQGSPAGRVRVIVDETATDAALGTSFGLPRDLDGDGLAVSTDVSTTAIMLPVLVDVRWGPEGGTQKAYRVPVVALRSN